MKDKIEKMNIKKACGNKIPVQIKSICLKTDAFYSYPDYGFILFKP
jgi:hypothetical protein